MNAPRMTKTHFQFLAQALQKAIIVNNMGEESADHLVKTFSDALKQTNPAFNAALFTQVAKGIP